MKVKLVRDCVPFGRTGEIVEVSPARADFLLRYGLADPVTVREQAETPEKRTVKKTTRTAKADPEKEAKTAKAVRTKK